ncbi:hypothetical protein pb186bvf_019870 [Paramecium bursaria]
MELERTISQQDLILTEYLHEILRAVTTRYTYLSQSARIMLIMFNISVPLTILNLFVTIIENYLISFVIALTGAIISEVITNILEGFFTGPKQRKIVGFFFIIMLNLGLLNIQLIKFRFHESYFKFHLLLFVGQNINMHRKGSYHKLILKYIQNEE